MSNENSGPGILHEAVGVWPNTLRQNHYKTTPRKLLSRKGSRSERQAMKPLKQGPAWSDKKKEIAQRRTNFLKARAGVQRSSPCFKLVAKETAGPLPAPAKQAAGIANKTPTGTKEERTPTRLYSEQTDDDSTGTEIVETGAGQSGFEPCRLTCR